MTTREDDDREVRFMRWLVINHASANTPIGDFARKYATVIPATSDGAELRQWLEDSGADHWDLSVLDVAWDEYEPPCAWLNCTARAADTSTFCPAHELGELL